MAPPATHSATDATTEPAPRASQSRIVGIASMLGTTIEWYDFFVYGTAAALVFNRIFFPAVDPLTGTLAAFATYAVGFFARPLGGIVFGHFGDRLGRKSMLLVTLLMMGVPTIAIGLIPDYHAIGYWAAVCLVAMRVVQGIAVGGEWGGAVLMAIEHAPAGKLGFFGSLPQAGVAPGLILSSLAMAAVSKLPEHDMLSWGWRVPFLASVVLLIVGWVIRIKVEESPDFEAMKRSGDDVAMPLVAVVQEHLGAVLKVAGARMAEVTWFYTVVTFALSYGTTTLGLSRSTMLDGVMCGAAVALLAMPLTGILGDRFGHRRVFAIGCVAVCLFGFPFFAMLRTGHPAVVYVAMVVAIGIVYSVLYATEGALFAAQFPASGRYSGISLAVQISGALGGGMAPILATWLLKLANGSPSLIALYLAFLGVVGITSTCLMRETSTS